MKRRGRPPKNTDVRYEPSEKKQRIEEQDNEVNQNTMEYWLDARYQKAITFDWESLSEQEQKENKERGLKTASELFEQMRNFRIYPVKSTYRPKKYDKSVTPCIHIELNEKSDHFLLVQIVMALNSNIPIHFIAGNEKIYWKQHVFFKRTRSNSDIHTFHCNQKKTCKKTCCIASDNLLWHKQSIPHVDAINALWRYDIINDILAHQMKHKCRCITVLDTRRQIYDNVTKEYRGRIPYLQGDQFVPFDFVNPTLKRSTPKQDLHIADGIKSFIEHELETCIKQCIPSATNRKEYKKELLYAFDDDQNFIMTDYTLLKMLFDIDNWSGDGTFAIRPVFAASTKTRNNRRIVLHDQVFKLFAVKIYDTKDDAVKVEKAYLVAIGLLTGRKQESYDWFFQQIKSFADLRELEGGGREEEEKKVEEEKGNLCHGTNQSENCMDKFENCTDKFQNCQHNFICDYEKALRNAASNMKFLHSQILGDSFHFAYNMLKRLRHIGLMKFYSRKKNNEWYDSIFRALVECIYALQYIDIENVMQFGREICRLLLEHAERLYNTADQYRIADFVWYFAHCYLHVDKRKILTDMIGIESELRRLLTQHFQSKRTSATRYYIREWSVYKQLITSNNSAEANNRWDYWKLGIRPRMSKLIKWFLIQTVETKSKYNAHCKMDVFPMANIHTSSRAKKRLLYEYWNRDTMDWNDFIEFSNKLAIIRTKHNAASPLNPEKDCTIDMIDLLNEPQCENESTAQEINENMNTIPQILNHSWSSTNVDVQHNVEIDRNKPVYVDHMKDARIQLPEIAQPDNGYYQYLLGKNLCVASLDKRFSLRKICPVDPSKRRNKFV